MHDISSNELISFRVISPKICIKLVVTIFAQWDRFYGIDWRGEFRNEVSNDAIDIWMDIFNDSVSTDNYPYMIIPLLSFAIRLRIPCIDYAIRLWYAV